MERRGVDLRKYQPKKVSSVYIVKVIIYTLVIVALTWFIKNKLDERSSRAESLRIEGVEIEP